MPVLPRDARSPDPTGTTVPSRNFTVRAVPVAALRADASDSVTNQLNATQNPLNSRRLGDLISVLLLRAPIVRPVRHCGVVHITEQMRLPCTL